jgi:hypothetical protein
MMGVAGLAVLGMTATLAGAQTVEVKEKPSLYRYVSCWRLPSAEGLDKFRAALGAALDENSLIGPAFGSMMVNFTPQADLIRVNATYK